MCINDEVYALGGTPKLSYLEVQSGTGSDIKA